MERKILQVQTVFGWWEEIEASPPAPLPRERGQFDNLQYYLTLLSGFRRVVFEKLRTGRKFKPYLLGPLPRKRESLTSIDILENLRQA